MVPWIGDTHHWFIISLSATERLDPGPRKDTVIQLQEKRVNLDRRGLGALIVLLIVYAAIFAFGQVISIRVPSVVCSSIPPLTLVNMTSVGKPVFPVMIDEDQIPIGSTETFIYHLLADHKYHIYLLGDWVDPVEHSTDYDIFVYEASGSHEFISSHTEAAGLPEQVGNDVHGRYFMPEQTGYYYFCVRNDPMESITAKAGTLMVIEHIEPNRWYSKHMHGKVNEQPVTGTNWAYEFNTSAKRIRVYVDVPDPLDMYEVRLYIVANPEADQGELLNGIPVAWEPGLRGETNGIYGGFNFDPQGFRHVDAMASCEHSGEDMVIDYEVPAEGNLLYHLALIAEYYSGTVEFIVQTDFEPPELNLTNPPTIVESGERTVLEASVRDETPLKSTSLSYSTDGGTSWNDLSVQDKGDGIIWGEAPAFDAGTVVEYLFEAEDDRGNVREIRGTYKVLSSSQIELQLDKEQIEFGDEVKISGKFSMEIAGLKVELTMATAINTTKLWATTAEDGNYSITFEPYSKGTWNVRATIPGDGRRFKGTSSEVLEFKVVNPSLTTMIRRIPSVLIARSRFLIKPPYLYGVIGGVGAVVGVIVFIRRRE